MTVHLQPFSLRHFHLRQLAYCSFTYDTFHLFRLAYYILPTPVHTCYIHFSSALRYAYRLKDVNESSHKLFPEFNDLQ
jgi:hypothetical protein